ncbi:MAG: hypothetical protein ACO2YV_01220, partial [Pseudomonadales bacterium]
MSNPADTAPATPAETSSPQGDDLDPSIRLLFDSTQEEIAGDKVETNEVGRSLAVALEDQEPAPPAATADSKKDDKVEPPPAPAPEPEPPKVKVRRKREPEAEPPAPPPVTPPAPQKTDEEVFEEGLLEEEKDQLELARFAEKKDPAKYAGYSGKVSKFLKDHQAYLKAHPDAVQEGTDAADEYQAWLQKNNVALAPREARLLDREMVTDRAAERARKEADEKLSELYDENFRRDKEPEIRKEAEEFFSKVVNDSLPQDLLKVIKEKGFDEAKKAFPMEFRVSNSVLSETADDVQEFRRLTTFNPKTGRPVSTFDPNKTQHTRIVQFIQSQCDAFKKSGGALRVDKEGRSFVTRDEWSRLSPEQKNRHWTFTQEQVITMVGLAAKSEIDRRIKSEYEQREKDGWVRRSVSEPAAPPPAP